MRIDSNDLYFNILGHFINLININGLLINIIGFIVADGAEGRRGNNIIIQG